MDSRCERTATLRSIRWKRHARVLQPRAAAFFRRTKPPRLGWLGLRFSISFFPTARVFVFDDAVLAEDPCRRASVGKQLGEELKRGQLLPLLKRSADLRPESSELDEHAPDALVVPSGSRIRLTYEPGRPPVWPFDSRNSSAGPRPR